MGPRNFLVYFIGVTSPYAKGQRDYKDVDNVLDNPSLSRDSGEDYDEYYEDYSYITNPSTFCTLKEDISYLMA